MGRQPQLARVQTDDAELNRVQDAVAQALGPMLTNPLIGAADFRFTEVPGATSAALPTFALQYRTPGTTTWVTILTADSTGKIAQPAWIAPTLAGTWSSFGTGHLAVGFMRDAQGFVHLRGLATGGGADLIFTLPAGYRPSAQAAYATDHNGTYGCVNVLADGTVTSIIGTNPHTFVTLDGITFDTRS